MSEKLCVVIPVYNERNAIAGVLRKWVTALDALKIDYVIRAYNDGSKDDSLLVMREAANGLPHVDVRDKLNEGHGPTILRGYREAAADGFDWVFQIDSDDEMGPERFPELWQRRADYDFLVGMRDGRRQALSRKIVSLVSRLVVRVFYGVSVWDVNTPYRLMRTKSFAAHFKDIPLNTFSPNVILSGLAAKYRLRCFEMPVPQHDRLTGEVSIKKWRLFKAAIRSFMNVVMFACRWDSIRNPLNYILFPTLIVGLFLSVWFFLSPYRLVFAILYLILIGIVSRNVAFRFLGQMWSWCINHPIIALSFVVALGCVERIVMLLAFPELLNLDYINNDFVWLYERACNLADGKWLVNKSWTTVVIWGGFIRLVGRSTIFANVFAGVIQLTATILGYMFVRRWLGRISAVIFAFLFFCSVNVLQHMPNFTATEHTYSFFVFASLCCFNKVVDARTIASTLIYSVILSVLMWFALWSRGEGIILWFALPLWIALYKVFMQRRVLCVFLALSVVSVIFAVGWVVATKINAVTSNAHTIFCSEDNLWPRLHGATLSSDGTCLNTNLIFILNQYQADHPDVSWERFSADVPRWGKSCMPKCTFYNCPSELVPYVKREIVRRWSDMSIGEMIPFVLKKEYRDWCGDYLFTLQATLTNSRSRWPYYVAQAMSSVFPAMVALFSLIGFVLMIVHFLTGRLDTVRIFPVLVVVTIVALNFAALALTESSMRYGYAFLLLWPIMGAVLTGLKQEE